MKQNKSKHKARRRLDTVRFGGTQCWCQSKSETMKRNHLLSYRAVNVAAVIFGAIANDDDELENLMRRLTRQSRIDPYTLADYIRCISVAETKKQIQTIMQELRQ